MLKKKQGSALIRAKGRDGEHFSQQKHQCCKNAAVRETHIMRQRDPGEKLGRSSVSAPRNAGPNRLSGGQWQPGESGNPHGRQKGSRNRATLALDALASGEAEDIVRNIVEAAKAGDLQAAALVLSRVWPPSRERPVRTALPALRTAHDVATALAHLAAEASAGAITPSEAATLSGLVAGFGRAALSVDLVARVEALEARLGP